MFVIHTWLFARSEMGVSSQNNEKGVGRAFVDRSSLITVFHFKMTIGSDSEHSYEFLNGFRLIRKFTHSYIFFDNIENLVILSYALLNKAKKLFISYKNIQYFIALYLRP